jgi:hypothetical protein
MSTPGEYLVLAYNEGGYNEGIFLEAVTQTVETTIVNRALTPLPPPIFSGMKLQEDILLGDLVLNTIDANNVVWVCTEIQGWWDLPDPDVPDVTRGWRDGSYDARGRWQARQITLNGVFFPPLPEFVSAARNSLIEAANLVYTGAWLKTKENPTRAAFVRLSGRPEIQTVSARGKTEFSIGLRAADPIKYSWNDSDPDGYDSETVPCKNVATAEAGEVVIDNIGNQAVSIFLEITGPIDGPATIVNQTTDEVLTIVESLRGAETRVVTNKALTDNVATLTTSVTHDIVAGDVIEVAGVDSTFNGTHTVSSVTSNTVSFSLTATNVVSAPSGGTVDREADVLEIDTYEREVSFNGILTGARVKIDTLTDWITLDPGNNTIVFEDEGEVNSTASMVVYYRSGWIG